MAESTKQSEAGVASLRQQAAAVRAQREAISNRIEALRLDAQKLSQELVSIEDQIPVKKPAGVEVRVSTKR